MNRYLFVLLVTACFWTALATGTEATNDYRSLPVFSHTNLSSREQAFFRQFRSATNYESRITCVDKLVYIFMLHLGLRPPGIHLDKLKSRMTRVEVVKLLGPPSRTWSTNEYELLCYDMLAPHEHTPQSREPSREPSRHNWLVVTLSAGVVADANPASDVNEDGWITLVVPYLTTRTAASPTCSEPQEDVLRRWINEED